MSRLIDLTGIRFGSLLVVERAPDYKTENMKTGSTRWKCVCDCGGELVTSLRRLKNGKTLHCGCKKKSHPIKHGKSHTRLHERWIGMNRRCYNNRYKEYKNYGGRGISVCDEWRGKHGAENFIRWAYENGWDDNKDTSEMTIDRIDVNGNYEPSNCRLVSRDVQANNKRTNIYVKYNNETMTLKQLCKKYDLSYDLVHDRYTQKGYTIEEAMFTPKWGMYKRHNAGRSAANVQTGKLYLP